jgi:hypothetical protein
MSWGQSFQGAASFLTSVVITFGMRVWVTANSQLPSYPCLLVTLPSTPSAWLPLSPSLLLSLISLFQSRPNLKSFPGRGSVHLFLQPNWNSVRRTDTFSSQRTRWKEHSIVDSECFDCKPVNRQRECVHACVCVCVSACACVCVCVHVCTKG